MTNIYSSEIGNKNMDCYSINNMMGIVLDCHGEEGDGIQKQ